MNLETDVQAAPVKGWCRDVLILTAACMLLYGIASWVLPLADPEESRCAEIVREMQRTGEWVVPHLTGQEGPYVDKPAPFFWMAAAGQKLTGDVELGGRLIAGLFALGAVLGTYGVTRSLAGRKAALLAGLVLATAGEFLFLARWYRMDMPFSASMWLAMACFWAGERSVGEGRLDHGRWRGVPVAWSWIGFYVCCAFAVVFKGPAGLVIPAGVVFWYLVLTRQLKRLLEFVNLPGIIVFGLIAAPWFVMMSLRTPGYAQAFFIGENIKRAVVARESHGMNPLLYIPVILAGLLPWTVYLPGACMRLVPRQLKESVERRGWLLCWLAVGVPLVFFMVASTRLVNYVLPCFPPLAVLVGVLMGKWIDDPEKDGLLTHGARALWGMVALMGIGVLAAGVFFAQPMALHVIPIAFTAVGLTMMTLQLAGDRRAAFLSWAAGTVVALYVCLIALYGPIAYHTYLSERGLARQIPVGQAVAFWSSDPFSMYVYAEPADVLLLDDDHPELEMPRLDAWRAEHGVVYVYVSAAEEKAAFDAAFPGATLVAEKNGRWLMILGE